MDVSVVIVTRNTRVLTLAAVSSVLSGPDGLHKEVIVVDNGSTDGTGEQLGREFPPARHLFSERNLGFGRANNAGVREGSGKFVLLLNSDARLKPGALAQAVTWMRAHPRCGIAGAQLLNPDGSWQNSIANYPTLATELLNKSLLRRLFPAKFPGKENRFTEPVAVETVIGAFMLIRRECWEQTGGFDERFFFFFEETDLCLQAARQGWGVMHLPGVETWHEQGGSAKKVSAAARIEYWRSRYAYFAKNHGPSTRLILRLGLLLRLGVDWLANGAATAVTLGRAGRVRQRLAISSTLWAWHLRGCPASMGLPR